jgi:hypothetical protein
LFKRSKAAKTRLVDQLPVATVTCPECWAQPGVHHELSCSSVSLEQHRSFIEAYRS